MSTTSDQGTAPPQQRSPQFQLLLTSVIGGAAVYAGGRLLELFEAGDAVFFPYVLGRR